ncbi:Neuropeptide FF receptor 2, partial [Bulinus truncatus]
MEMLVNSLFRELNVTSNPFHDNSSRSYTLNTGLMAGSPSYSGADAAATAFAAFLPNGSLLCDNAVTTSFYDDASGMMMTTTATPSFNNVTELPYSTTKQKVHIIVILSVLYGIVFILALVGNISVVAVVAKDRSLHTATNFFLVNMAIADMLIAIFCLPITLLDNIFQ